MSDKLELRFEPSTIEHLGIKMYTRLPSAIAELIANAYDADATKVVVELNDIDPNEKYVKVTDNGNGMTFEEINSKFLRIGRRRRIEENNTYTPKGRKITGRKGLGKLAIFGIGETIIIKTKGIESTEGTKFTMSWRELLSSDSGTYSPEYNITEDVTPTGTEIIIKELKRKSGFNVSDMMDSLANLFHFGDESFNVYVSHNGGKEQLIDRMRRFDNIDEQFQWDISEVIEIVNPSYDRKKLINGQVYTSFKPLKSDLKGITLYSHGRMANGPSFFDLKAAGHVFSYMTGWVDADFLDEFDDKDVISTQRSQIDWDEEETKELQTILQSVLNHIVLQWSIYRKEAKTSELSKKTGVDLNTWYSKVPKQVKDKLGKVVESITSTEGMDSEKLNSTMVNLKNLIPEYTYYHYRNLNKTIKEVAFQYYVDENYYTALLESIKVYIKEVGKLIGTHTMTEHALMENVFSAKSTIQITDCYDTDEFTESTLTNIQLAHRNLSIGLVQGARHPIAHEVNQSLNSTGVFTEQDCLDTLSLLSHLFNRVEKLIDYVESGK